MPKVFPPETAIIRRITHSAFDEIVRSYASSVQGARGSIDVLALAAAIEHSRHQAMDEIFFQAKIDTLIKNFRLSLRNIFDKIIPEAAAAGANIFAESFIVDISGWQEGFVETAVNTSAAATVEATASMFLTQRELVSQVVSNGFASGASAKQTASSVRRYIGLDCRLERAFQKFIAKFKEGSVEAVKEYRKLMAYRHNLIARTEVSIAARVAQNSIWSEAITKGSLPSNIYEKEWIRRPASRHQCKLCDSMDGQRSPIGGQYRTEIKFALNGPPAHGSCECAERLVPIGWSTV